MSPAERRAARAERIKVSEGQPYGWVAHSESGSERDYHIFCHPKTKRLVCTCADYVYRGGDDPQYECKHIAAVLKFIGRWYLINHYKPLRGARDAA